MKRKLLYLTIITSVVCAAAFVKVQSSPRQSAAAPSISLPVLSFVVDGSQSLRPILGITGAASISAPLDLGFPVNQAAAMVGNDHVLVTRPDGNSPTLLQLRDGAFVVRPLDVVIGGIPAVIDRIALSPGGSVAALLSEAQHRIYVWTNLAETPALSATFDIGQLGALTAFAISDDGRTGAAGASGGLFLLSSRARPRLIAPIHQISAISFLHRSSALVAADEIDNWIYKLSGGNFFPIAGAEQGIAKPAALAVSGNNQRVFAANAGSGSVTVIGDDGSVQTSPCNCSVTGLHSTTMDSVYRLTDFSGSPVVMFDAAGPAPRLFFVPVNSSRF